MMPDKFIHIKGKDLWTTFDYAFFIDQELNVLKSGLTLEQAAEKCVPSEYRDAAIKEYMSWQQGKETA